MVEERGMGKRGEGVSLLPCACVSHRHVLTCVNLFITCSHTVVTGKRTVCKEERIVLQKLHPTDIRQLNSNLGYFTPVPHHEQHYPANREVVWQLQAMEGHRVYLELSQIDLRNEDGKCSDYIEISFNPCTPPTKICDNRVNSYTWATSQTRVQVRFVSDSKHTEGSGFRGAYYYYPVNTSSESANPSPCLQCAVHVVHADATVCSPFTSMHCLSPILSADPLEDALKVLRATNSSAERSSRRKRRAVLKHLYVSGMLTESQAGNSGVTHRTRSQSETLPLVRMNTRDPACIVSTTVPLGEALVCSCAANHVV